MAAHETEKQLEPRGFGEHARGLSSEYAHELGWGLEQEQRTKLARGPQDISGGTHYDYGARDFGDEPLNEDRFTAAEGGSDKEGNKHAKEQ